MVKKLVKLDYVDTHFKDEVLEREKMSSTAFGNFAIFVFEFQKYDFLNLKYHDYSV